MPQLLLIRHCESTAPAAEASLTDRGHRQARALAATLARHAIDHVISSPYRRARETIAPFAATSGLPIHLDPRLAERVLPLQPIDQWRDVVRTSFTDLDYCVPGGESGRATLERGWAALEAAWAAGHRLPALATHGQLMSLVLHRIDATFGFSGWESLTKPDIYLIERLASGEHRFARAWR